MILVDASVWVSFFRGDDRAAELAERLDTNDVLLHPWVLGELLLGGLGPRRERVIEDLRRLPEAPRVSDQDVLELVLARGLAGKGVGWVDSQLLASALVADCAIWTFDGNLAKVADELGIRRHE